jgi:hypothetical protein
MSQDIANTATPTPANAARSRNMQRAAILFGGLVLAQVILFGPSLVGLKILLPLDHLALPRVYLPLTRETAAMVPHNPKLSDLVISDHINLRFACDELRAGRLPLWNPYNYAGTPFALFPKFCPFHLPYYCFPRPLTLAWIQLLKGVVGGLGAYLFFRRVLCVGFWPAAVGAWCFPLTGFFVFWQGYALPQVVLWLPWLLLATDRCIRRPRGLGGLALALVTTLTILGSFGGEACQVLLCSGLFALWCLLDEYRGRFQSRQAKGACLAVMTGWTLGFMLAAPYVLPLVEYSRTGGRMMARASGDEERPPAGLVGLPMLVLPYCYGSHLHGCMYVGPTGNHLESPAAAYTGLLITLVLAPVGWCSRRHRGINIFWALLALAGLGWSLNLPVLVGVYRLPVLNMLSFNRFVFAASFAVLAMAVVGLNALGSGDFSWRRWFLLPVLALLVLGSWSLDRAVRLPEPVASERWQELAAKPDADANAIDRLAEIVRWQYRSYALWGAALCGLGVCLWLLLSTAAARRRWFRVALPAAVIGDLLLFAYGVAPQTEPALYYPPLPALTRLAEAPPGRVLGVDCLPPNLNQINRLRDVRGYDGVDPRRFVQLLYMVADKDYPSPPYAATWGYVPKLAKGTSKGDIRVPPILNMLGLRYLIFRGRPREQGAVITEQGYFVVENYQALPRVSVPGRVKVAPGYERLLNLLAVSDFDPARVVYVDGSVQLRDECQGTATIQDETPTCINVAVDMKTPGVLLLADRWNDGWRAYLDGQLVPILRANCVLRAVEVPAGRSMVRFRYEPASLVVGLYLLGAGLLVLVGWALAVWYFKGSSALPR